MLPAISDPIGGTGEGKLGQTWLPPPPRSCPHWKGNPIKQYNSYSKVKQPSEKKMTASKPILVFLSAGSQFTLRISPFHRPVVEASYLGVSMEEQPKENGWSHLYPCFWRETLVVFVMIRELELLVYVR